MTWITENRKISVDDRWGDQSHRPHVQWHIGCHSSDTVRNYENSDQSPDCRQPPHPFECVLCSLRPGTVVTAISLERTAAAAHTPMLTFYYLNLLSCRWMGWNPQNFHKIFLTAHSRHGRKGAHDRLHLVKKNTVFLILTYVFWSQYPWYQTQTCTLNNNKKALPS